MTGPVDVMASALAGRVRDGGGPGRSALAGISVPRGYCGPGAAQPETSVLWKAVTSY